jgi:hypothetical protein
LTKKAVNATMILIGTSLDHLYDKKEVLDVKTKLRTNVLKKQQKKTNRDDHQL